MTVADHLRDTVFGQVVRFLLCKGLLRYPDEIDPYECERKLVQRSNKPESTTSGDEKAFLQKNQDEEGGPVAHDQSPDIEQNDNEQAVQTQGTSTRAILVDWYDDNDQEVRHMFLGSTRDSQHTQTD